MLVPFSKMEKMGKMLVQLQEFGTSEIWVAAADRDDVPAWNFLPLPLGFLPHFLVICSNVTWFAKLSLTTFSQIWRHPHPCMFHCLPRLYSSSPHLSPPDITVCLCDGLPPRQCECRESRDLCLFCSRLYPQCFRLCLISSRCSGSILVWMNR